MASLKKKKILLADSSKEWLEKILQEKQSQQFTIRTVTKGSNLIKALKTFKPDLVIVELMLPEIHGIEILKLIKESPLLKDTGVILTSYHTMIQNHHSAVQEKVDYFLTKPCPAKKVLQLACSFFTKTLPPLSFQKTKPKMVPHFASLPSKKKNLSYIKFWGTRGSNPVSGADYVRFGGNTPSLEIRQGKDLVIIDAGTGIRGLGQSLSKEPKTKFHILFSHTHLDHLAGFPFFYPIHQSHHEVAIWAPVGFETQTKEIFSDLFAYAYFPVAFEDIRAKLTFHDLRDSQTIHIGSIKITTHYAFHPGSTLCFKIEMHKKKIAYVTDNEFLLGCELSALEMGKDPSLLTPYASFLHFLSDCDVVIHEAQYTAKEYKNRIGWGHSSVQAASFLIKKANIKHWIITHHDPRHTDEFLLEKQQLHRQILQEIGHECLVQLAYDGMILPIE